MVAVLQPEDLDVLRKLVGQHLLAAPERVSRSLRDERRRLQRSKMLGAQLIGFAQ